LNKKNILLIISIVVIALLSCSLSENDRQDNFLIDDNLVKNDKNLEIKFQVNSIDTSWYDGAVFFEDFESGVSDWTSKRYYPDISTFSILGSGGIENSQCLRIISDDFNDACFYTVVDLSPSSYYNCIGWIKSENIELDEGASIAGNLCIMDSWWTSGSTGIYEFNWEQVSFTFSLDGTMLLAGFDPGTIKFGCRLGFFCSLVKGTVYFDNIGIYELPKHESEHFTLVIEPMDMGRISEGALNDWLDKLDLVYEEYHNLVGGYPFDGEKITILSVLQYPGGWAVAGNPIQWHQPWVGEELESIESEGHWSFGMIHEIGHDYDIDERWIFDCEHWANFKLTYVVEMLNAKVPTEFGYFQGDEIYDFWERLYEKNINDDDPDNDVCPTTWFCWIKEEIGWEPFKETFRDYLDGTVTKNPTEPIDRFNLFLDVLSSNTQDYEDVRDIWPEDILNMLIDYYGGSAGIVER